MQDFGVNLICVEDGIASSKEAGRRTPPHYIPRLIAYQLKFEQIVITNETSSGRVSIVSDPDVKKSGAYQ